MNTLRPIIVEGPDGAGKTWLCRDLAHIFKAEIVHTGGRIKDQDDYDRRVQGVFNDFRYKPRVIFDRVPPLSELVYGQTKDPEDRVLVGTRDFLRQTCRTPIVVMCHPPRPLPPFEQWAEAQKAKPHKPEHDLRIVHGNQSLILARYRDLEYLLRHATPEVPLYSYRYDAPTALQDVVNFIVEHSND